MLGRGIKHQRGLSLVELMVGITVGLIVVAGASVLVAGQLSENRRLVAEAQVQQDLRATADIIVRELRRAGMSPQPSDFVWDQAAGGEPMSNSFTAEATLAPAAAASANAVSFAYPPQTGTAGAALGFRLNTANGSIESGMRGATPDAPPVWQELTDRNTLKVTEFTVERLHDTQRVVTCPNACPDGSTDCWPRVGTRAFTLLISAESRAVPTIKRRYEAVVRPRNDDVPFNNASRLCPA